MQIINITTFKHRKTIFCKLQMYQARKQRDHIAAALQWFSFKFFKLPGSIGITANIFLHVQEGKNSKNWGKVKNFIQVPEGAAAGVCPGGV